MSDNTIIVLEKTEKGYEIEYGDCESNLIYKHYIRETLSQAVKKAKQLQDENNPEYGLKLGEI